MPLLPPACRGGRPRSVDLAQVLNAILYILVTGDQWRMPPTTYPKWQTIVVRFRAKTTRVSFSQ